MHHRMVPLFSTLVLAGSLTLAAPAPAPQKPVAPAKAHSFQKITIVAVEGKITPDVVRVHRGDLVRLTFLPKDGTYGVYIPVLKLKGKATPDRPVTFEFAASSEGEYEMRCTKYWGFKHWSENGKIVVE
jgi:heme/copper-type cytochrome/quinol oxidase subunit 2